jgi:ferric-dicitrate binding protein FerR (iron transport regulator)
MADPTKPSPRRWRSARSSRVIAAVVGAAVLLTIPLVIIAQRAAVGVAERPRATDRSADALIDGGEPPPGRLPIGAEISAPGSQRLEYDDGTLIDVGGGAHAKVLPGPGKRLELSAGRLGARVTDQPEGRPLRVVTPYGEVVAPAGGFTVLLMPDHAEVRAQSGAVTVVQPGGAARPVPQDGMEMLGTAR